MCGIFNNTFFYRTPPGAASLDTKNDNMKWNNHSAIMTKETDNKYFKPYRLVYK